MENPIKMDVFGGTHISGNLQVVRHVRLFSQCLVCLAQSTSRIKVGRGLRVRGW